MKTCNVNFASGVLVLAVQGALATMFAMPLMAQAQTAAAVQPAAVQPAAETDEVAALVRPTNTVEIGLGNVSDSSAKFGEYNGLNKAGGFGVGNFNVRGGDAYDGTGGVRRWGVTGTDIGTTSREAGANIADQGLWSVGLRYDELYHAISDSYETPLVGVMGGNVFTFPSNFGLINTTAIAGSNNPAVGSRNLNAAQLGDFHPVDVGTTRKNTSFAAGFNFDRQWNMQFDYNHLDQSGAKIISGGTSKWNTVSGYGSPASAAGTFVGEAMVMQMNPTQYKTDTFNLALNYVGESAYFTAGLYSSIFTDEVNGLYFQNPYGTGSNKTGALTTTLANGYQQDMLSTAPSNIFNQFNFKGGYAITPTTKVAGGFSYGRNDQNQPYNLDTTIIQAIGTSMLHPELDGLVITKNINLKVVDTSFKSLTLDASAKYNERENESTSYETLMYDIGGGKRLEVNAPYSNSKKEYELGAGYRLTSAQNLRLAYTYEEVERWCQNYASAVSPTAGGGTLPAGSQCVIVPSSKEDKVALSYRFKVTGDLNLGAVVSEAHRKATVDQNAITPLNEGMTNNQTGFINSGNFPGYVAFFDASRNQKVAKADANWQALDSLNLSLSGKYTKDEYPDSALGVQNGHSSSINFDSTFAYAENGTFSFYATAQKRDSDYRNGANPISGQPGAVGSQNDNNTPAFPALIAPSNVFSTSLHDKDTTLGLNLQQKGLLGGKLEMNGDVALSLGNTYYATEVPYYWLSPTSTALNSATCSSLAVMSCGSTPNITNRTLQFKLAGIYSVDKHNKVTVRYMYQKENAVDYFYNVYQLGYSTSTAMPTNQVAPNYTVNVVALSYTHLF